ncbi:MAG: zinc metalloprotease HtpX [Alphaproteobacteria bacterium]|nr:zinc metalloprotease HtpX [Alphaproteobacteria bacterium]
MNAIKTSVLMAGLTALFGWAGHALAGQTGMLLALFLAAGMNLLAYWNADKMVLAMYGARPVESGKLVEMVHDLARRAGLPLPKVYVIETAQPNAFATGRNPRHAAVAVTRGILDLLDARELRGVLGHELTHVRNGDTLTMTLTATLAGALSTLANFAMFFGGGSGRDRQGSPLVTLLFIVLAPLAAMLVQLAISRTREYAADQGGAEITGDPEALADALLKIDQAARRIPNSVAEGNPGTAHMFIVNPLSGRAVDSLFSTHPATENRIAALQEMFPSSADGRRGRGGAP